MIPVCCERDPAREAKTEARRLKVKSRWKRDGRRGLRARAEQLVHRCLVAKRAQTAFVGRYLGRERCRGFGGGSGVG